MIFILILVSLAFGIEKNTPPYTFTYGTPALPDEVNINFDTVDSKCDQLVDTVNRIRNNTILDTVYADTCFVSELVGDSIDFTRGTFDSCFISDFVGDSIDFTRGTFDTTKTTKANIDTLDTEQIRVNYGASGATASATADELVIEGSGSTGLSIITPDAQVGRIVFASAYDDYLAGITWQKSTNAFRITTNNGSGIITLATTAGGITINSGNVGINETSPAYKLDVGGSGNFEDSVVCDSVIANRVITNAWNSDTITADTMYAQKIEADTLIQTAGGYKVQTLGVTLPDGDTLSVSTLAGVTSPAGILGVMGVISDFVNIRGCFILDGTNNISTLDLDECNASNTRDAETGNGLLVLSEGGGEYIIVNRNIGSTVELLLEMKLEDN